MLHEYPQAHMSMVNALEDFLPSMQILVIRGDAESADRWAKDLRALYAPARMIFAIPEGADLPPALAAKSPRGETVAYLCTGMTCSAPLANFEEISRALTLRVN